MQSLYWFFLQHLCIGYGASAFCFVYSYRLPIFPFESKYDNIRVWQVRFLLTLLRYCSLFLPPSRAALVWSYVFPLLYSSITLPTLVTYFTSHYNVYLRRHFQLFVLCFAITYITYYSFFISISLSFFLQFIHQRHRKCVIAAIEIHYDHIKMSTLALARRCV